jgi:acetoacetate decarboxylase
MPNEPAGKYRMPLIIGPELTGHASQVYCARVEILAVEYRIGPAAVRALLPECFQPAENCAVKILFGYSDGLASLAGGGFRWAAVQVTARFKNNLECVDGDYIMVMFADQTWPIICGREDLGIPQLFASISPLKNLDNGFLRCEASLWGHHLFGLELAPLQQQNAAVRLATNRKLNGNPCFGFKYIPALDGPPDAAYPILFKSEVKIDQLWEANTGRIYFGSAGTEEIGRTGAVLEVLKKLPLRKLTQAWKLRGSAVLRYDLARRLEGPLC